MHFFNPVDRMELVEVIRGEKRVATRQSPPWTFSPTRYALAIFLSAFLLFQVQPLIGKCILPWFGGTPRRLDGLPVVFPGVAVLRLCLRTLGDEPNRAEGPDADPSRVAPGGLAVLPIAPNAAWKPTGNEEPVSRILILLAVTVGLPVFCLSTTGPLFAELV